MARIFVVALLATAATLLAACTPIGQSSAAPRPPASASSGDIPIGELGNLSADDLRTALLGDPPYPSGWEDLVERQVATVAELLTTLRVPETTGMAAAEAACRLWQPIIGHTGWANGAFVERQFFIAHMNVLATTAPDQIRHAAESARNVSSAAASEQMKPGGDSAVVSRRPKEEIRTIGLWAVENCGLPVVSEEAPDTQRWTEDDFAESCGLDRRLLEDAQERYRAGPGEGRYAEHPHVLEVTVDAVMPSWHRSIVDNGTDPPTLRVEPIPGSFCDR